MSRILPILFNTDMVRAILDGRKTVTRRIIKPNILEQGINWIWNPNENVCYAPYRIGNILYVRETWGVEGVYGNSGVFGFDVVYKAGEQVLPVIIKDFKRYCDIGKFFDKEGWIPSLFMPKESARIWLKVTDVRVERLQDITEEQARAEGCVDYHDKTGNGKFDDVLEFDLTARDAFVDLWNSTLKKTLNTHGRIILGHG